MLKFNRIEQNLGTVVLLGAIASLSVSCQTNSTTPTATPSPETPTQEIKITGSGSTYPAMKKVAAAYETQETGTIVNFLPDSQSETAIAAVKDNLADLGSISKQLKDQDKNSEIVYQSVARDALMVATHPSVENVTNLTTEQLKAIYSGTILNWKEVGGPDATIVVLDRPEDESGKRLLRQHYLGKDQENTPEATILRHESDLITALQSTPYSIGASSLAYSITNELPVNPLSLDGVAPTQENVEAGKYPMVRHIGVVYRPLPSDATQDFLNFTFSTTGADTLNKAGFVPSRKDEG
ncbi:substrate-binding domain-containing protein [Lusitaniella coriacea LEGE 07157]|uniref:Substrate-binding domain-containing protein n=1 Tax=Lusitaniella coriacea LEGE 07157 TaxID=945747 RepID=A0A8J7DZW8_9CYAN|nr:substrate-binding domain-containing protein [Lusitaniella coriacea]MBE9117886.1 substrate-binding domain-containing protein [Lusitaniella coriacea LEGE 07157]